MSNDWLRWTRDPNPWMVPMPLPSPIKTARTVVRLYQRGDGPTLFRAIQENRSSLLPWMVWARTDHQEECDSIYYVEKFRRNATKPDCTDFPMGIFSKEGKTLLGGTGLHYFRANVREAEIGYWIGGKHQGEGLCTEAVGALISSAFTSIKDGGWGLRRIVIFNAVSNIPSRRVCEKLGLRFEMRMRQESFLGPVGIDNAPGYHDKLGFAVLESEWDFEKNRAKEGIAWKDITDIIR